MSKKYKELRRDYLQRWTQLVWNERLEPKTSNYSTNQVIQLFYHKDRGSKFTISPLIEFDGKKLISYPDLGT